MSVLSFICLMEQLSLAADSSLAVGDDGGLKMCWGQTGCLGIGGGLMWEDDSRAQTEGRLIDSLRGRLAGGQDEAGRLQACPDAFS